MWKRVMGLVMMLLASTGLVLSVAGVFGTWYAQSVISAQITQVAGRIDVALEQADAALTRAAEQAQPFRASIEQIIQRVEGLTASDGRPAQAAEVVTQLDTTVLANYTRLRDTYAEVRERTGAAVEGLELARRLFPRASLPELPVDQLLALDKDLRALDATLRDARSTAVRGAETVGQVGQQLVGGARQVRELGAKADRVKAGVVEARERLPAAEARLQWWLTLVAITLTAVSIWSIVLHISLFGWGRRWWRERRDA